MKSYMWSLSIVLSAGCGGSDAQENIDTENSQGSESDSNGAFDSDTTPSSDAADDSNGSDSNSNSDSESEGFIVPIIDTIDNMEDGSGRILAVNGRQGVWYVTNDNEYVYPSGGTQWPPLTTPGTPALTADILGGRDGSLRGMHTFGGEFQYWAGIGIDLDFDGTVYRVYDAAAYSGFTFFARSGMQSAVSLRFGDVSCVAPEWGGNGEDSTCNLIGLTIELDSTWKQYWVLFDDVCIEDSVSRNGLTSEIVGRLLNIQFFMYDYGGFDVWIDDIAFFSGQPNCGSENNVCIPEDCIDAEPLL